MRIRNSYWRILSFPAGTNMKLVLRLQMAVTDCCKDTLQMPLLCAKSVSIIERIHVGESSGLRRPSRACHQHRFRPPQVQDIASNGAHLFLCSIMCSVCLFAWNGALLTMSHSMLSMTQHPLSTLLPAHIKDLASSALGMQVRLHSGNLINKL